MVVTDLLSLNFSYLVLGIANNQPGTAEQEFDALIDQATSEPDEAKRMELYGQARVMLVEDALALFVYEKNYRLPMRSSVQGFIFNGVSIETLDWYALHKTE